MRTLAHFDRLHQYSAKSASVDILEFEIAQ